RIFKATREEDWTQVQASVSAPAAGTAAAAESAQQPFPCQASRPSFAAMAAMTRAAIGSAQDQPSVALGARESAQRSVRWARERSPDTRPGGAARGARDVLVCQRRARAPAGDRFVAPPCRSRTVARRPTAFQG